MVRAGKRSVLQVKCREAGAAFHLPDRENLDLLSETHGDYHTPTTPERAQRHADIADRTIGFDDHPYASLLGITSIGQPLELIGRTRARILHQAVRDDLDMLQARVRCRLVVRSSTRS